MKTIRDFSQETQQWSSSFRGSPVTFPAMDLDDRLRKIEDMLMHEQELRDKYPALKEAHENYKLILKLVEDNSGNG